MHSVGFKVLGGMRNPVQLDQVRLACADQVTVSSIADSGVGSLRKALGSVCVGGTSQFAPALAGQTIVLTSGSAHAGQKCHRRRCLRPRAYVSGSHTVRVFIVNSGTTAAVRNLTVADGYGYELAGGILNNGVLTLDHVVVAGNQVTTACYRLLAGRRRHLQRRWQYAGACGQHRAR